MPTFQSRRVAGCDLNVWSSGSGPVLLFLHGFERHPGAAPFLMRLADHRHVLAPEHPGYEGSDGLDPAQDILDLVLIYRELIASLGDGPVDVLGHSLGGMVAAELAAICPNQVRQLVLVDPFGLWLDADPAVDPFGPADVARAAKWHDPISAPAAEEWILEPDPEDPALPVVTQIANLAAAARFLWPIPDRGLRRRLPLVTAPTLVINGEFDGLVPVSYAEEFVRLIPGARLAPIAESGHYPMFEREPEFLSVVDEFLSV